MCTLHCIFTLIGNNSFFSMLIPSGNIFYDGNLKISLQLRLKYNFNIVCILRTKKQRTSLRYPLLSTKQHLPSTVVVLHTTVNTQTRTDFGESWLMYQTHTKVM